MTTREEWLNEAARLLKEKVFNKPNRRVPQKVAISCGVPKGSSAAVGQCWDATMTKDGTSHVFVCPSQEEPRKVVEILTHELVHTSVGVPQGHGKEFGRVARAVGLEGKLTATKVTERSPLYPTIGNIVEKLGPYPHRALNKNGRLKQRDPPPKRVKLISPYDDEFSFFLQESLLEEFGLPKDPWGNEMVVKEKP